MKHTITFEISLAPVSTALQDITRGLHALGLAPDCLIWSEMPGGDEARLWLTVEAPLEAEQVVVDHFRVHSYIRLIRFEPGQTGGGKSFQLNA